MNIGYKWKIWDKLVIHMLGSKLLSKGVTNCKHMISLIRFRTKNHTLPNGIHIIFVNTLMVRIEIHLLICMHTECKSIAE